MERLRVLLIFGVLFLNEIACFTIGGVHTSGEQTAADKSNWSNIYTLHPDVHIEVTLKDSSKLKGTLTTTTPEFISIEITSVIETRRFFFGRPREQKEEKRIERQEVFRIISQFKSTKYRKEGNAVGSSLGFLIFFFANKESVGLGLANGMLGLALGAIPGYAIGLMIDLSISDKEPVVIYEADEVSAEGIK